MVCPNCGKNIVDGAKFCTKCGKPLGAGGRSSGPARDYADQEDHSGQVKIKPWNNKKLLWSGLALLLVLVVFTTVIVVRHITKQNSNTQTKDQAAVDDQVSGESQAPLEGSGQEESADESWKEVVGVNEEDVIDLEDHSYLSITGQIREDGGDGYTIVLNKLYSFKEGSDHVIHGIGNVAIVESDKDSLHNKVYRRIVGKTVKLAGDCYIDGQELCIVPDALYNKNGRDLFARAEQKEGNKQQAKEQEESGYIIPDSDTRVLTQRDVEDLSLQEINYAKNEIYARHGRRFQSYELQEYFNSQDWYQGTVDPEDFTDSMLNAAELQNARFLSDVEFSINPNGYQLDQ